MKKILLSGLASGIILLVLSLIMLNAVIMFFPVTAEEYYNDAFNSNGQRDIFFYIHPFILSFGLAWFWHRFKGILKGNFVLRGLEIAAIFAIVAILPNMWMTYSSLSVSILVVGTWFLYGFIQVAIAGILFAKMNP